MTLSKKEYGEMAKKASPNTKFYLTLPKAFVIGGLICTLGQVFVNYYQSLNLGDTLSGTATSVTLIFLSALLTGLGLYSKLSKHGGAGTLVPITGFANAVVSPALEFKSEGMILGLAAKLFVISGPVIVYGMAAAWLYGLYYYFFG